MNEDDEFARMFDTSDAVVVQLFRTRHPQEPWSAAYANGVHRSLTTEYVQMFFAEVIARPPDETKVIALKPGVSRAEDGPEFDTWNL